MVASFVFCRYLGMSPLSARTAFVASRGEGVREYCRVTGCLLLPSFVVCVLRYACPVVVIRPLFLSCASVLLDLYVLVGEC